MGNIHGIKRVSASWGARAFSLCQRVEDVLPTPVKLVGRDLKRTHTEMSWLELHNHGKVDMFRKALKCEAHVRKQYLLGEL